MTGLTRNFRGSRGSPVSADDSSSTSGEVGVRRLSIISENIVRLNRFLALLTLRLGSVQGRHLSPEGSTRRSCCEKHRDWLQKGDNRLCHVTESSGTLLLRTSRAGRDETTCCPAIRSPRRIEPTYSMTLLLREHISTGTSFLHPSPPFWTPRTSRQPCIT
ncbi:uncharacterized protein LOC119446108 [Dermacentor silvarum]|uniref:uncharacterized protein LOC119446108 n=1 Tax=Dermacentor silvarum TaxID=543639 RepID=UPI00189C42AA|nr:uncharacterized protein LOC119446108 [Dermacentor silvarum]